MEKKIPMRQCLGCREMKPKKELVRVIKTPDNKVLYDKTGKLSGRGAYVCPGLKCLEKAIKSNAIGRSLGINIPDDVYAVLKENAANYD